MRMYMNLTSFPFGFLVRIDFASRVLPDLQWCAANNVAYQRTMFPGFAWSNWNGGLPNCKQMSN